MEQKRFILAMVLSGIVLLFWQAFLAPRPPEPLPTTELADERVVADLPRQDEELPAIEVGEVPDAPDEVVPPRPARDIALRADTISAPSFTMELTNRGAAARSIVIIDPEQYQRRGNLLEAFPEDAAHYPFTTSFAERALEFAPDTVYEVIEDESARNPDGTFRKIVYRHLDPRRRFVLEKIFEVHPDNPYSLTLRHRLTNQQRDARLMDTFALNIFGHMDHNQDSNFLDFRPDELEGVCRLIDDTERKIAQSIEEPLRFERAPVLWGAVDTRYFMTAAIPMERAKRCSMEIVEEGYLHVQLLAEEFSIAPGQTYEDEYLIYVGPKDYGVLKDIGYRLEESVDYGFFTFFARPLRWALVLFFGWLGNWGLAIILLTLVIKALTWPITEKAYVNAERMKLIQPKMKELKEKYANDQQRMTEETMKLFKENKVSPLGCLPMLIQIPILYALFVMIYNSVELYQAPFALWYVDLSSPDPYFVLPILMGGIMVVQQSMMTMPDNGMPQMKIMMKVMPIIFTAFMLFLPAGLVLYYLINLVLGLAQQFMIKRKFKKLGLTAEKS